jgi:sterol desaturase/sphingolipid hydroxylase (fatty acid hydroxylase superfamily)
MEEKYVAFAIPFFLAMIGIELVLTQRRPELRYRFADSINNLSCGIGQQVLEPFMRTASLAVYVFLYEHARVGTVPLSTQSASLPVVIAWWAALVVGVDLFYYVFHRASHRVNLFWASHVVHHQSEEYNLAVALRQSWVEILLAWVFYLPLAVLGFSPLAFVAVSTLNTLYQFWIHTRVVGRCPAAIEWLFNTPSHHRVHHGVNPKYIDKNYGGMFIVWDRLFGTFQAEEEEPVYGTVKPLASWNPLWANSHYWVEMVQMAAATRSFVDKLRVPWMPPEWRPLDTSNGVGYVTIPEASRATQVKYDAAAPLALSAYVAVQFAVAVLAVAGTLLFAESAPVAALASTTALVLVELVAWGALFEGKAWGAPLAVLRLVATVGVVAWFTREAPHGTEMTLAMAGACTLCIGWVLWFRPAAGAQLRLPGLKAGA